MTGGLREWDYSGGAPQSANVIRLQPTDLMLNLRALLDAFSNMSADCKRALEHAADEALSLRSNTVYPQHVMLGFLREPTSIAARCLEASGATRASLIAQIARLGSAAPYRIGEVSYGIPVQRAVSAAHGLARQRGVVLPDSGDLLIALSDAGQDLYSLLPGMDTMTLSRSVSRLRSQYGPEPPSTGETYDDAVSSPMQWGPIQVVVDTGLRASGSLFDQRLDLQFSQTVDQFRAFGKIGNDAVDIAVESRPSATSLPTKADMGVAGKVGRETVSIHAYCDNPSSDSLSYGVSGQLGNAAVAAKAEVSRSSSGVTLAARLKGMIGDYESDLIGSTGPQSRHGSIRGHIGQAQVAIVALELSDGTTESVRISGAHSRLDTTIVVLTVLLIAWSFIVRPPA